MKRFNLIIFMMMLVFPMMAQVKAVKNPQTGKWGFLNSKTNKTVVKAVYDDVDQLHCFTQNKDFAIVKQGGYWGAIDQEGNTIIKIVITTKALAYKAATLQWRHAKPELYLFDAFDKTSGKYGYVNYFGDWIIKPVFDEIDATRTLSIPSSEYAIVKYKGGWGTLSKDGKFLIKPVFMSKENLIQAAAEWAEYAPLGQSSYLAQDGTTKKKGFVNYLGNWIVKPSLDDYDPTCFFSSERNFAVVKKAGKWGCVDRGEVWIVKPTWATAAEAKKMGYQWQSKNPKSGTKPSQAHNINDGKYNMSLLVDNSTTPSTPTKPTTPTTPATPTTPTTPTKPTTPTASKVPTIRIISPKEGSEYTNPEVTFVYEARTADGSKATIDAYINGEKQPATKGIRQLTDQITLTLPRKDDVCRIQLIAKDANGLSSEPAVVRMSYKPDNNKPFLHVISVGVSDYDQADLKLQHAAKDAGDFLTAIKNSNLSFYKGLSTAVLIQNKEATDRTIKKQLSQLVNKVEQGDVILIYFSGHGAKEEGDTYFLSVNAESDDLFSSAVSFDVLRSATKRMKDKLCKIIIFMDACHSGSMYGLKGSSEPFTLADPGIIGFYSSTETQKSTESEQWKNGIFTKALIDGLNGKAADEAGDITIDGLEKYIRAQVRQATSGKQMPIFENKQGNYILFPKK